MSPNVFTHSQGLEALCEHRSSALGGIWTCEGEVPWFILNHDEIGMMQLIGPTSRPKSSRMT